MIDKTDVPLTVEEIEAFRAGKIFVTHSPSDDTNDLRDRICDAARKWVKHCSTGAEDCEVCGKPAHTTTPCEGPSVSAPQRENENDPLPEQGTKTAATRPVVDEVSNSGDILDNPRDDPSRILGPPPQPAPQREDKPGTGLTHTAVAQDKSGNAREAQRQMFTKRAAPPQPEGGSGELIDDLYLFARESYTHAIARRAADKIRELEAIAKTQCEAAREKEKTAIELFKKNRELKAKLADAISRLGKISNSLHNANGCRRYTQEKLEAAEKELSLTKVERGRAQTACEQIAAKLQSAEAQVAKLREALERIAELGMVDVGVRIARATLSSVNASGEKPSVRRN